MSTSQDFMSELKKQLGFLERSCKDYDEGYKDEAIRIAVAIRVLIHHTKSPTYPNGSVSLLSHLNSNHIGLVSTASPDLSGTLFDTGLGHIQITTGDQLKVTHTPKLGNSSDINVISVDEWWNQRFTSASEMTRKMLVLDASNKDGGAHVAGSLPARYANLRTGTVTIQHIDEKEEVISHESVPDVDAVALRQMAYELLTSRELVEIAYPPPPSYRPKTWQRRTKIKYYLDGNR